MPGRKQGPKCGMCGGALVPGVQHQCPQLGIPVIPPTRAEIATKEQTGSIISRTNWQLIISVLAFLLTISTILWKGGALSQEILNLQQQVTHQQTQLDELDKYFRK